MRFAICMITVLLMALASAAGCVRVRPATLERAPERSLRPLAASTVPRALVRLRRASVHAAQAADAPAFE